MKKQTFEICGKVTFKEKGTNLYNCLAPDERETEKMKSEGLTVGSFFSRKAYKIGEKVELCSHQGKLYEIT